MFEMPREPMARRITASCFQHPAQLGFQLARGDAHAAFGDLTLLVAVAQSQARLKQILYGPGEGQRRWRGDLRHLAATLQQKGQTTLMECEPEPVIGRPSVVNQKPVVCG